MSKKLSALVKLVTPVLLLASVFAGTVAPAHAEGSKTIIRLDGLSDANATNNANDAAYFVSQGWYNDGLRFYEKKQIAGTSQTLSYTVTDEFGAPLANKSIKLIMGKAWSASNAKVSVDGVAAVTDAVDCGGWFGYCIDQAFVLKTTDSLGKVTFTLDNADLPANGADYNADPTARYTGTHLFSQIAAVSGDAGDVIDIIDMVYTKSPDAPVVKTVVARMDGLNESNSFTGDCNVGDWCKYYAAGLRYFERGLTVGSTTTFSYTITDTDGAAYANKTVHLLLGKGWSGSTARVTVNGQSTSGADCWCGNDQAVVNLTTDAQGKVSFELTNNDSAVSADPYQAANLPHPGGGKHLFTQMTIVGEKGNNDVIDIVDLNFYKPADAPAPTVYKLRLADWNAGNSFDGTHVWGDAGISQGWFDTNTGYFAHYVKAGSTFNLRYRATLANGDNAPDGTPITVHLGSAWSGSNASFTSGSTTVVGAYPNGAGNDQASFSTTVSGGYITIPLTSNDSEMDATTNPGSPRANPDSLNPLFMQVKVTVDGNSITHQDWVNIIVTKSVSAPSITSVSSTTGKKGQAIDIVGTNLGDALGSTVTLYTAATTKAAAISTPVTVLSVNAAGTRMTVLSPTISQKGYFKVTNSGGTATASAAFTASTTTTTKPAILLTSSLIKEVGSTFTLNGTNLASASNISIGGVSASFSIISAGSVLVTVPEGVTSGSTISATNLGGTVTSTKVVYQAASITESTASAKVGQTVTITGKNLKATSVIFGGNKSAKPVINTGTTLTVVVPNGALTGAIKITTGAGVFYTDSFTVIPPAPTVASFTPTTGRRGVTLVTVKGTNLLGATVTVGTTQVTVASGASSTSLKFVVPAGASSGRITVTTAGGSAISTATLTVTN